MKDLLKFAVILLLTLSLLVFGLASCQSSSSSDDDDATTDISNDEDSNTPLSVVSCSPDDYDTFDTADGELIITFNKAIKESTVTVNTDDTTCSGSIQLSDDDFDTCVQFSSGFTANDTKKELTATMPILTYKNGDVNYYKIKVTGALKDTSGNALEEVFISSAGFHTPRADFDIQIDSSSVYQGYSEYTDFDRDVTEDVKISSTITVEFSPAMEPSTITTNSSDTTCSGTLQLSSDDFETCLPMTLSETASLTSEDGEITLTPNANLDFDTGYQFKIDSGITSAERVYVPSITVPLSTASAGELWTDEGSGGYWRSRAYHASVTFDDKIWIMGGTNPTFSLVYNDIWYSADGETWTESTSGAGWSQRYNHRAVVYDGKIWVMGGYDGSYLDDVWYSEDGASWTRATASAGWSARASAGVVVFNGKMWVMGGNDGSSKYNDVWYSTDGATWTQATSGADWNIRSQFGIVVFDNKIWVMGGFNSNGDLNDVWYSSDGTSWTEATASADWSDRRAFGLVAADDYLVLTGGYYESDNVVNNQVYSSTDGISWQLSISEASWSDRAWHTTVLLNNKIYLAGGIIAGNIAQDDVWWSEY